MGFNNQKGAAAVEFAIVLPLLLVFLFGIIEFSLLFYNKVMITNASREGARAGIVFSETRLSDAEIEAVVDGYCEAHLITFGSNVLPPPDIGRYDKDTSAAINLADVQSGDSLSVTVKYTYEFLVLPNLMRLLQGSYSDQQDLTAVTVMRYE